MLAILAYSSNSFGLANYWQYEFGQGYDIYAIDINAKTHMSISCGEGNNDENSVYILKDNKILKDSEKNLFEFIINERVYTIPASTDYTKAAASWTDFIDGIKSATHFKMYVDGKLYLEASPSPQNTNQVFANIDCKPKAIWE